MKVVVFEFGDAIRNEYDNIVDDKDIVIVNLQVYPSNDDTAVTNQVGICIMLEFSNSFMYVLRQCHYELKI